MGGLTFPFPWGFDVGLTVVSLALVALFSTAGIAMALRMRIALEPEIKAAFPFCADDTSLRFYFQLMVFIIGRVSVVRLLVAVALIVVGAAGCHHVGMWSMRGTGGVLVMTELTYLSVFFTIGIGGSVGVVSVLAFLLVPDGIPGVLASFALAFGISLFHCSSAAWGMQFVEGAQSFFTYGGGDGPRVDHRSGGAPGRPPARS
eukprot:TRINITY_DN2329_c0_g1_i2.p3 TRINITY_DN2329_c0_g1~~TRINITY_DN2329_c0_g1_i2.p3  ORF type:complete len:203 (+),score=54.17 TRINITY_DN2329_c0_g1_i2:80-688(+)